MTNSYHEHRKYMILNLIHRFGPISRTRLVELTDYRPASVGEIIRELLEQEIVVESGALSMGHGRKRTMLEINKDRLCAIGVSFSDETVTFILAGIDGSIFCKRDLPLSVRAVQANLSAKILSVVRELIKDHADKRVVGIGLCDVMADPTGYQLRAAHFTDWIHTELHPLLEKATDLYTDAFSALTLPAMAEQRFGVARGASDFFCVELSNGIGISICCNGKVVPGANGMAGEIGHTIIDAEHAEERMCYCGKPGCVECTTAYPALVRDIRRALDSGTHSVLNEFYDRSRTLEVRDIRRALDQGDQLCRYYVKRSAKAIGIAIANAVNLLNPELVIPFGFMLELGDWFTEHLEESIRENVLTFSKNFEIRESSSMDSLLPLGAVAEIFSHFLRMEDYQWVYQMAEIGEEGE